MNLVFIGVRRLGLCFLEMACGVPDCKLSFLSLKDRGLYIWSHLNQKKWCRSIGRVGA